MQVVQDVSSQRWSMAESEQKRFGVQVEPAGTVDGLLLQLAHTPEEDNNDAPKPNADENAKPKRPLLSRPVLRHVRCLYISLSCFIIFFLFLFHFFFSFVFQLSKNKMKYNRLLVAIMVCVVIKLLLLSPHCLLQIVAPVRVASVRCQRLRAWPTRRRRMRATP